MPLRSLSAVAAAGMLVVLTGCSSGDEPRAAQSSATASASATPSATPSATASGPDAEVVALLDQAKDAFKAAPYARTVGSASGGGSTFTMDVLTDLKGNGSGAIGVGKGKATLLLVGPTLYVKGDQVFWIQNGGAQIGHRLGGKWMQVVAKDNFQDLQVFLNRVAMAGTVFAPTGAATKSEGPDGATWVITGSTGTLVLDKATSRPLKYDGKDDSGSFTMSFSYPAQASIQAPPKSDVAAG